MPVGAAQKSLASCQLNQLYYSGHLTPSPPLTHTLPAPDYSIVGADKPVSKSIPPSGTMRPNAYFVNDTHQYYRKVLNKLHLGPLIASKSDRDEAKGVVINQEVFIWKTSFITLTQAEK